MTSKQNPFLLERVHFLGITDGVQFANWSIGQLVNEPMMMTDYG